MNPINNADDTTNDKKWKVLNEKGLSKKDICLQNS